MVNQNVFHFLQSHLKEPERAPWAIAIECLDHVLYVCVPVCLIKLNFTCGWSAVSITFETHTSPLHLSWLHKCDSTKFGACTPLRTRETQPISLLFEHPNKTLPIFSCFFKMRWFSHWIKVTSLGLFKWKSAKWNRFSAFYQCSW